VKSLGITTRMIAEEAGLSIATVSVVLNRRGDEIGIKPETQRRVLEIARRLNFVRNPLAAGLRGGRTRSIGILWSFDGPYDNAAMIRRIALHAQKHGYFTHVADHLADPQVTDQLLGELAQRRVDAVVMQESQGDALHTPEIVRRLTSFPAAVLIAPHAWDAPCDLIVHDRLVAFRAVVDHFAAAGRRRPALLVRSVAAGDKIDAFLARCRECGMSVDDSSIIHFEQQPDEKLAAAYWRALASRFGRQFPFDALHCSTDEGAVAAMAWLRSIDLQVPHDVAVAGSNDSTTAEFQTPALASIDRRDNQVADTIKSLVFNRLSSPTLPLQRRHIPMRFIWRESAGKQSESNSHPEVKS